MLLGVPRDQGAPREQRCVLFCVVFGGFYESGLRGRTSVIRSDELAMHESARCGLQLETASQEQVI